MEFQILDSQTNEVLAQGVDRRSGGSSLQVAGVATLTLSGEVAVARVTPAGGSSARYTALKMGAVTADGTLAGGFDIGLTVTLNIDALDYDAAAPGYGRLDWASAFDLDGDGTPDVIDPGAELALAGLAIDLPGSLEFALTGSLTGLSVTAAPVRSAVRRASR